MDASLLVVTQYNVTVFTMKHNQTEQIIQGHFLLT